MNWKWGARWKLQVCRWYQVILVSQVPSQQGGAAEISHKDKGGGQKKGQMNFSVNIYKNNTPGENIKSQLHVQNAGSEPAVQLKKETFKSLIELTGWEVHATATGQKKPNN